MKKLALLPLLFGLTACEVPVNPVVSDYNGDSVTIVTPAFANAEEARRLSLQEATNICQRGHRKRAEFVSSRSNPSTYENYNLFLCLND